MFSAFGRNVFNSAGPATDMRKFIQYITCQFRIRRLAACGVSSQASNLKRDCSTYLKGLADRPKSRMMGNTTHLCFNRHSDRIISLERGGIYSVGQQNTAVRPKSFLHMCQRFFAVRKAKPVANFATNALEISRSSCPVSFLASLLKSTIILCLRAEFPDHDSA